MAKYRVWCLECVGPGEGEPMEARSASIAARQHVDRMDQLGEAFPDQNNGDKCSIAVCPWDSDADDPEHETFSFMLRIEQRIEQVR